MLDEYEGSVGIPSFGLAEVHNEAKRLLNITPAELPKLSAEECGNAAYVLKQFAWHLQRAVNREQGRVRFAEESIRRLVSPRLRFVQGSSSDERKAIAIRGDDAAEKLDRVRVHAQLRLDRLAYQSSKVTDMAKSLEELSQTKRRHRHD